MTQARVTASRKLLAIDKNGREFELTIGVGAPYEISKDQWICAASTQGLHERVFDLHGVDSWQALQLASQFVAQTLAYFIEGGGRLFSFEERAPIALEDFIPRLGARSG
ncbi:MAG TPA: hypothetical protein VFB45_21700 [Pseudolabrys sp.]|nr:hypothetical protein [Pseudolabrys sp.]